MRGVCLALVFAAVVSIATGTAAAANYAQESLDRYFRIKYQEANAARPVVSGYVSNMHPGLPVDRMQLVIEALDASGKVVGTSSIRIPAGYRPATAATSARPSYRVQVLFFDSGKGGGS